MASYKTRTKAIRIKNEVDDYFSGKPLNRAVESLCEKIKTGEIGMDSDGNLTVMGVHTEGEIGTKTVDISDEDYPEFKSMVGFMGGEREFFHAIVGFMSDGAILNGRGGYEIRDLSLDTEEFKEMCREKGLDPQTTLNKATNSVKRGWL